MRAKFPLPDLDWEPTRPFWESAARGTLAIPRNGDGEWEWYPRSKDLDWVPVSGRGTVFSWTEVRHAFLPAFAEEVPFLTGLVALEEAPHVRLAARFVDTDEIEIGDPVQVVFRPLRFNTVSGSVMAPFFRRFR